MSVFTPDIEGGNTNAVKVDGSAVTQPVSGTVTATQATGTNLHVVTDATSTTIATQATGTNLHTVTDTGSTTAVTGNVTVVQPTGTNLHTVIDSGTTVVTQPTGTNLHVVVDSGTITTTANKATAATITRVATSTVAATVLTANAARKKFIIRTETGTHTYVAYGSTATSTNYTYDLGQDATLEDDVWTGSVSVVRLSGTGSIQVTDLT